MYNAEYHPVDSVALNWMLAGESAEHQQIIRQRVQEALDKAERNYMINLPDGTYYTVTNGLVTGGLNY